MAVAEDPAVTAITAVTWTPRTHAALLRDQLAGIDAWNRSRRAAALREPGGSRETRLDQARLDEALRRSHLALLGRTDRQLRDAGSPLHAPRARLVLAHRNDWFKDKLSTALRADGVEVVARLDNGADAVGVVVAEQPDLLLVEDRLPMIGGAEVIRQARLFAPATIAVAQVADDQETLAFLAGGARTAFSRRVPPGDVAQELSRLVRM